MPKPKLPKLRAKWLGGGSFLLLEASYTPTGLYRRTVGRGGVLTVHEAAAALKTYSLVLYRLAISGKLVTRVRSGVLVIPFLEVKRLRADK